MRYRPAARLADCISRLLFGYVAGKQRCCSAQVDGRQLPDFGDLVSAPLIAGNSSSNLGKLVNS